MERNCGNCKHYRNVDGARDKDGNPVELGYCHATRNFATRRPGDACKRFAPDERKVWNY